MVATIDAGHLAWAGLVAHGCGLDLDVDVIFPIQMYMSCLHLGFFVCIFFYCISIACISQYAMSHVHNDILLKSIDYFLVSGFIGFLF